MAALVGIGALNRSSAKVATFAVKLAGGKVIQYEYTSKKDGNKVTALKFEVWMIGENPAEYCIGYVKGNKAVCDKAAGTYKDGSVWALSKVAFDAFTAVT